MRAALATLLATALVGCGSGGTSPAGGVSFGPGVDADSRPDVASRPADATTRAETGAPPALDAGPQGAVTCDTPCASCSGACSAGRCYETVVSHAVIVNNVSAVDSTALYWLGVGAGGSIAQYSIWRADKGTGAASVLTSYAAMPTEGYVVVEPVAGGSLGATFFTTGGGGTAGASPVFAASPAGARVVYSPDGGLVTALSASAAGLIASVNARSGMAASLVRISLDGGAPTTLYAEALGGLASGAGAVRVFDDRLAWVVAKADAAPQIVAGSVDGDAPLAVVAASPDNGSPSLFAVDATYAYWSPAHGAPGPTSVVRAPLAGGAVETFVTADLILSIAVDATDFYWLAGTVTGSGASKYSWAVRRTPTASAGGPQTLLSCEGSNVSIDDSYVYLTNTSSITRTPK